MLRNIIENMPAFREFSGKELCKFADMNHSITEFKRGETIIKEGDSFTSIYIILKGSVKIVKRTEGHTIRLARLNPGEIFGEMSFFSDKRRHCDAIAGENVQVLKMDEEFFEKARPSIKDKLKNYFIELLIERLDTMNESLISVSKLMRVR